jgi:hypothetical protein
VPPFDCALSPSLDVALSVADLEEFFLLGLGLVSKEVTQVAHSSMPQSMWTVKFLLIRVPLECLPYFLKYCPKFKEREVKIGPGVLSSYRRSLRAAGSMTAFQAEGGNLLLARQRLSGTAM